jgi:large subunit ribosomal protein L10
VESLCLAGTPGKDFFILKQEGGESKLAFTKERKSEIVAQYEKWLQKSQAVFVMEYSKMNMKTVNTLRAKLRDVGGEVHVVKNTLFKLVLDKTGAAHSESFMGGSSVVCFALSDAPAMAKALNEATAKSEIFTMKGGYLGAQKMSPDDIKALAALPPLATLRAKLLGTLLAPATQLVRTLAEPARSMAAVLKSYSEKEAAPAA